MQIFWGNVNPIDHIISFATIYLCQVHQHVFYIGTLAYADFLGNVNPIDHISYPFQPFIRFKFTSKYYIYIGTLAYADFWGNATFPTFLETCHETLCKTKIVNRAFHFITPSFSFGSYLQHSQEKASYYLLYCSIPDLFLLLPISHFIQGVLICLNC